MSRKVHERSSSGNASGKHLADDNRVVAGFVQRVAATFESRQRPVDRGDLPRSKDHVAEAIDARARELFRNPPLTIGEHAHSKALSADKRRPAKVAYRDALP